MKRIFTKRVCAQIADVDCGAANTWIYKSQAVWTVQEDIIILGAFLHLQPCEVPTVDGDYITRCGMSQAGVVAQDGRFMRSEASFVYKSVAAAQEQAYQYGSSVMSNFMLPEGYGIPIREEGVVYLNMSWKSPVANSNLGLGFPDATIYYVKGKCSS